MGKLAQCGGQGPRQPIGTQVQVLQGGQTPHLRWQRPGQQMSRQVQVAQAGQLPQLRRECAGQGAVFDVPLPVCAEEHKFEEFQIQMLQPVQLAQFRPGGDR